MGYKGSYYCVLDILMTNIAQVLEAADNGLTFEGLIDALLVLYEECNADKIKKECGNYILFWLLYNFWLVNYGRFLVVILKVFLSLRKKCTVHISLVFTFLR